MELDRYYGEIASRGIDLFAVSVDPPEVSAALKQRLESDITFLSDEDGVLLDALGIRHRGGRADGGDISFPTAVLVDGRGVVRWTFESDTYRQRARTHEIFQALDSLG